MNGSRVLALVGKEIREIVRDPITVGTCLLLPVIMLFLFGYAVSLDVENVALGVLDHDKTPASRDVVDRFLNSGHFRYAQDFVSHHNLEEALNTGEVRIALVIPDGFHADLLRNDLPEIQTIVDGTHSATSLIVANYARSILAAAAPERGGIQLESRIWYNPSMLSIHYFVPGLYGVLLMSFPPLLTALAIVREKETGSAQQIFASPVLPAEFILGKLIPYGVIAFLQMVTLIGVGYLWFGVEVRGSLVFLLSASLLYVLCTVGIGLLISTITHSQLAAMLGALMITLMPSYLFSGFLFPIFTMPFVMRMFSQLFPTGYFVEMSRGIVMKGAGIEELWGNLMLIGLYTFGVFVVASRRFKKKVA